MIRLLLKSGKVLLTRNQSKIKSALEKGAKKITKKESDKILKTEKGIGGPIGKFLQKDEKVMQVPMATKQQMKRIRKSISKSVKDFMSKNVKKKKGGVVTYKKGGFTYAIK
jgi:hypothetical protein|tara:strand:+ start:144 stop:476 length:333 start_codon:yes stop_codon:yes gene_type:complete